jgi:nitric oxide reductase NorE protein
MGDAAAALHRTKTVPGILTFVAADTANFILFFGYFMVERGQQPVLFARSAGLLDIRLGLLNTVILISSGWLVALAVAAARAGAMTMVRR